MPRILLKRVKRGLAQCSLTTCLPVQKAFETHWFAALARTAVPGQVCRLIVESLLHNTYLDD